jgi:hypothetical protein
MFDTSNTGKIRVLTSNYAILSHPSIDVHIFHPVHFLQIFQPNFYAQLLFPADSLAQIYLNNNRQVEKGDRVRGHAAE